MMPPNSPPGAPTKNRGVSHAWAMARAWRAERDEARTEIAQLLQNGTPPPASALDQTAELSRVWALARRWRAERDVARAQNAAAQ